MFLFMSLVFCLISNVLDLNRSINLFLFQSHVHNGSFLIFLLIFLLNVKM